MEVGTWLAINDRRLIICQYFGLEETMTCLQRCSLHYFYGPYKALTLIVLHQLSCVHKPFSVVFQMLNLGK